MEFLLLLKMKQQFVFRHLTMYAFGCGATCGVYVEIHIDVCHIPIAPFASIEYIRVCWLWLYNVCRCCRLSLHACISVYLYSKCNVNGMKTLPFRQIKSPGENTTGRNRSTSSHRKPASVFWNISTRFKVSKWTFIAISACRKLPPEI